MSDLRRRVERLEVEQDRAAGPAGCDGVCQMCSAKLVLGAPPEQPLPRGLSAAELFAIYKRELNRGIAVAYCPDCGFRLVKPWHIDYDEVRRLASLPIDELRRLYREALGLNEQGEPQQLRP
jgi:hypothetical protein